MNTPSSAERPRSVARRPAIVDPVRELRRVGRASRTREAGLATSPMTAGIGIVRILEQKAAGWIADNDPLEHTPPKSAAI